MKNKIITFVSIGILFGLTGCTHITGTGEKVGEVIKVSNEGVFFKTNEIEVIRGGMQGGSGGFSTTPLNATVNDPGLLAKVNDALNKQYEVKVKYVTYFWTPLSSDSNSWYVTSIEPFNPPKTVEKVQTNPSVCFEIPESGAVKITAKR